MARLPSSDRRPTLRAAQAKRTQKADPVENASDWAAPSGVDSISLRQWPRTGCFRDRAQYGGPTRQFRWAREDCERSDFRAVQCYIQGSGGVTLQFRPNSFSGKLIIVEGIDGSGKSTQLSLLTQWLRSRGYVVSFSEWNSSPIVKGTTRQGKKKQMFTPTTFSLIHATDFADRLERHILPMLEAGAVVCADRYAYTAFARDVARGVRRPWVRNLYRMAVQPDLAFLFRVPLDVALKRILGGRAALKYYEAGMDLNLSPDIEESFALFQQRILEEYDSMAEEMGFHVIDATGTIQEQQKLVREIVINHIGESLERDVLRQH